LIRRSLVLSALLLLGAALSVTAATAACASKHIVGTPTPTAVPTVSATPASSSTDTTPPIDAFVIYRDQDGNLVARDFSSGASYVQTVDYNSEVIVQSVCSNDGSKVGYLIQYFSEKFRRLDIRGTGAPAQYIQVSSNVQGFAWSPDSSKIALAVWDNQAKKSTITLVDVASGQTTDIWNGTMLAGGLAWSPDGTQLVFDLQDAGAGSSKIALMSASGGEPHNLVADASLQWLDPIWTPDGKSIIATGLSTSAAQLYRIDADSGQPTQLTQDPTIYRRDPQFSPDGNLIAFTGSIVLQGVSAIAYAEHQFGIFTVNPDGSNEKALTVDPRTNPGANVDPYLNAYLLGWCKAGPWLDSSWVPQEVAQ